MKKATWMILILLFIMTVSTVLFAKNLEADKNAIKKENLEYERYLGQNIYGAELATIINKAIDENEKNKVRKDEKNYYIENEENSIKIYINMKTVEKTYLMEEIYNNNITEFVKYLGSKIKENEKIITVEDTLELHCQTIEYHKKNGKIRSIIFEEILEE